MSTGRPTANLIMPMAGRGSRFANEGFACPKPLIELAGRPFFWWATQSILRQFDVPRLVFVVLQEHVDDHGIDRRVHEYYPEAILVSLPQVTRGALATALAGLPRVHESLPLIVNDCDHCFEAGALATAVAESSASPTAMLCHFHATKPIYSFAQYDDAGMLRRTAEKQAISDLAIAGAYWFRSARLLQQYAQQYCEQCPYDEVFVSGIHNTMAEGGETVRGVLLERHLPFGVVAEYRAATEAIAQYADWLEMVET